MSNEIKPGRLQNPEAEKAAFAAWLHEIVDASVTAGYTSKVQRHQTLTRTEEEQAWEAWQARAALQHPGYAIGTLHRSQATEHGRIIFTPIGDPHIKDGMQVYADPGGAERLRLDLGIANAAMFGECEKLRAQLAEQDAQPQDPIIDVLKSCLAEGVQPTFSGGDLKHLIALLERQPK